MSKCETCIFSDRCDKYHIATDTGKYAYQNIDLSMRDDVEEICDDFKDKSLFVELPVKLGQICYALHPYKNEVEECRVSSLTQKADGSWKIRLTHNHSVFEIRADEIGKTVFLDRAEAEKKLQEMENLK